MDHSGMDHSSMDHHQHHNHMHHAMETTTGMSAAGHDMQLMDNGDSHAGHGSHMGGHRDMGGHGGMMMYFHFSSEATILFESWKTTSWEGMLGSCIAIFILASLYEGLKVAREYLLRRSNAMVRYNTMPVPTSEDAAVVPNKSQGTRMLSLSHGLQTLLHILQVVVSYFLMLIFMTYNVWLCLAVALGAGTGYFLFSWKRAIVIDINEHCH